MLPVPDRIGRYHVIDRLASGGMAEVFICAERQSYGERLAALERLVVVKRILPHLAIHPAFVDMFLAEARYVARINHQNVVAIYEPSDRRRLRSTVMWRAREPAANVSAWEVVVSAQTSLLEVDVALAVWSEFTADDLLWSDARPQPTWHALGGSGLPATATAVLARRRGSTSAVIAVHPADARRIEVVRQGNRSRVGCWLFSAALEKGVLLRSRVLAAIGPGVADEAWATRLLADFAASPPPLTA